METRKYFCDRCGKSSDKEMRSLRFDRCDLEPDRWIDLCDECANEYILLTRHLKSVETETKSAFLRGEIEWI